MAMIPKILAGFLALSSVCGLADTSACFAEEGFNGSKRTLPEAIQPAWDATFSVSALPDQKGGIGSAVLVASRVMSADRLALYMLTADHVVSSKCGPQLG